MEVRLRVFCSARLMLTFANSLCSITCATKRLRLICKMTSKLITVLTINLGVRWDVMVPFTETKNQIVYVDATKPNPDAGGRLGAATKFGSCAGCSGIERAAIHWRNLQPRVGLAYKINDKTVLRSGFFMSYLDGGAYEYGTSFAASFMSNLLAGEYIRAGSGHQCSGLSGVGMLTHCRNLSRLLSARQSAMAALSLLSIPRPWAEHPTSRHGISEFKESFPGRCF